MSEVEPAHSSASPEMSRATSKKLRELFLGAAEIEDTAARTAFLDRVCGEDTDLRRRLEELLTADQAAGPVPPQPAMKEPHPGEGVGSVIGRYKLLQQIGEGGCGVVYMAEQLEPVRRQVALKIIKLGMDTRSVIVRFEAERQALALMDHPNIAKVHDAGATETGRPYFVMELVRGIKITDYCDQNNLPTRQRLDLFIQVCDAVQHAHQKGVIHRDLKPSNILVTQRDGVPVPKVIDFGIAKAITDQQLTDKTLFTAFEQFLGTPAYMSPEQAELSELGTDTRSDIYSLGVLLYELLTGKTPFDSKELLQAGLDAMRRTIREKEAPTPSTRLSAMHGDELSETAKRRGLEPPKLVSQLRGDLDWIAMKCLEKDRARRYQTANGVARDIERHLKNEPVTASPPGTAYRLAKFVRRNKTAVLAGGVVATALVFAAVLSMWDARQQTRLRRQAQTEQARAETEVVRSSEIARILQDMLAGAGPGVARGRDGTLLKEILDNTATRVQNELKDQPEIQGDLNSTLASTYRDLGDFQKAKVLQQLAVDEYRRAFGNQHWKLALALGRLGFTRVRLNNDSTGQETASVGLEMARKCADKKTLAACLYYMARSLSQYPCIIEQEPYLREAVAIQTELGDDPVALAEYMSTLACCLSDKANLVEKEQLCRQALDLDRQRLGNDHPRVQGVLYGLAQCLLEQNRSEEAKAAAMEAVELGRKIFRKDNDSLRLSLDFLSNVLVTRGEWNEAEQVLRQAVADAPSSGWLWHDLARFEGRRRRWAAATEDLSRAVELDPNEQTFLGGLAIALLQTGRVEDYRQLCHRFLERFANTREVYIADWAAKVSLLLPVEGTDFEHACQLADFTVTTNKSQVFPSYFSVCKGLADYRRDRFDSALDWANRAITNVNVENMHKSAALFIKASAYARLDNLELARQALSEGDESVKERHPDPLDYGEWPLHWAIADFLRSEAQKQINGARANGIPSK
jgi:serine/threonine protein kinase/tetratricopeptide (TPR) repeat protein